MDSGKQDFPQEFVTRLKSEYAFADELLVALNENPPISVRLHPIKGKEMFENSELIPWCKTGRYLTERPIYTLDPCFHAGCYYPQEAGSMLVSYILSQLQLPDSVNVLDLCAAPGGKSTIILDHLPATGVLISNEIIRNRAYVLRDNVSKWGAPNVIVTNNKPEDFQNFENEFDLVVVDAPCSGEGMFRKDINARSEWSMVNAETCSVRQTAILDAILPALKAGGILIYSTCTFNKAENEEQMRKLIDSNEYQQLRFEIKPEWGILDGEGDIGYYAFPGKAKSEGFFICVLRKLGETIHVPLSAKEEKQFTQFISRLNLMNWLNQNDYNIIEKANHVFAFSKATSDLHKKALLQLNCLKWGIRVGEVMRDSILPNQELAWSNVFSNQIKTIEVNREEALKYLKGEPVSVNGEEGWCVVTYHGLPLGWVKAMRTRSNNYFPKELRIRMELK
jgi:16S rRNA C967 or C1407 C5-methylase (RsmB/RsmF family)/NOL1/NOP2/fmu family ribosome biogenesis protein